MTTLSDQERLRFTEYLRQEADSCEALARQLEKLGGPATVVLANRYRAEAAACKVVAGKLAAAEAVTLAATTRTATTRTAPAPQPPKEADRDK